MDEETRRPKKELTKIDLSTAGCCKKGCIQSFPTTHLIQKKISEEFKEMLYGDQNTYLNGLLHRYETKKSTGHARKPNPTMPSNGKKVGRPPAESSKFSFYYNVRNPQVVNIRVCQKAFCSIHGFGPKRLQVLRCKMQHSGGISVEPDKRGKHSNRHSVSEEVRELIRTHI